ncbi:hypothetical protein NM688_g6390 [Phlebia brevispora]|uniref:Uncharacterized protein n=1 Tax=Phlebia brevispora TaxID=194682 RepID=A0ACC1SGG9_9APHY|nr:hypothetical protein NM688_g6390 [Phlebia brevispora]
MPSRVQEPVVPLDYVQEKLRLLEIERQELQSRLSQLETEIEEQQRIITKHSLYEVAPIDRLPTEILLRIFFIYIHLDDDEPEAMLELDLRPVTISHVCQNWRYTCLAASELWTNLVFNKPSAVQAHALRSKERPLDIVHAPNPCPSSNPAELYRPLESTRRRWRSVFWDASLERTKSLLQVLNYDRTTFSHLRTLDIRVQARESPCKPILFQTFGSVRFPRLSRLVLSGISPSELPPATAQCLRHLHIHFPIPRPYPNNPLLPPYLRMSSFCAYLSQASKLEAFVLEDCTPLMDVYLHTDPGRYTSITSSSVSPIRATLPTSAVSLPHLRRFEWTSAPPKDLWRLFHFLNMPALRHLDLSLGKADDRWFAVQERAISPMLSSHPLSLHAVNAIVQFEALQELRVFCCDVDGLTVALRKMQFPALEKLELYYDDVSETRSPSTRKMSTVSSPKLPQLESMFREPRLAKLTQLTLSGFILETSTLTAMLAYMPALQYLYVDSCKGTASHHSSPSSVSAVTSYVR